MSSKEQEIIDRFLERGGNIMIMGTSDVRK